MFRYFVCNILLLVVCTSEYLQAQERRIVMTQGANCCTSNTVLAFCCFVIDVYKQLCSYVQMQQTVKKISYSDFLQQYPDLLFFEEQITNIQSLLFLSRYGTMPEQVLARLMLVKSSLPYPYDQVAYQCAQKLYKTSFDKEGHFLWLEYDPAARSYKKFFKKVPQNYKKLILAHKAYQSNEEIAYKNDLMKKIDNSYNQKLLDVIYAGIQRNYPRLRVLCRQGYDALLEKLYEYYIEQNESYEDCEVVEFVPYDVAVLLALDCSDSKNDVLTQELADTILMLTIFSVESKSEEYDSDLKDLYDLLFERVGLNRNVLKK